MEAIKFEELNIPRRKLLAKTAIEFPITEDNGQLHVVVNDLALEAKRRTREELIENLSFEMAVLWYNYAVRDPATLNNERLKFRQNILATFEEADGA